ncbi:DUF2977 domain-containing protein [Lactiplantibacillus plantarum]|nr:DUF2977 domain-containing protein [Lactiplantibacillus plantarum]
MQIEVNNHNEIIAYDEYDELTPAIQIDPSILPEDFSEKFIPSYYLYVDGKVTVNATYTAPVIPIPDSDQVAALLTLQVAQNKSDQDTVNAQLLLEMAQQTVKETA